jgi:hypothetical protein
MVTMTTTSMPALSIFLGFLLLLRGQSTSSLGLFQIEGRNMSIALLPSGNLDGADYIQACASAGQNMMPVCDGPSNCFGADSNCVALDVEKDNCGHPLSGIQQAFGTLSLSPSIGQGQVGDYFCNYESPAHKQDGLESGVCILQKDDSGGFMYAAANDQRLIGTGIQRYTFCTSSVTLLPSTTVNSSSSQSGDLSKALAAEAKAQAELKKEKTYEKSYEKAEDENEKAWMQAGQLRGKLTHMKGRLATEEGWLGDRRYQLTINVTTLESTNLIA